MTMMSAAIRTRLLCGASDASGSMRADRQSAPQIVVDPRAHGEIRFERLRECQQRHRKAIEEFTAPLVFEPRRKLDEILEAALLYVRNRFRSFSLWRQRRIRMRGERQ